MSDTIQFFVAGSPKAQPRAKAFARKFGDKWMARVYDPKTAEGWKAQIAVAAKPHLPAVPLGGPISLKLDFYMPRPKSHYGTGKKSGVLRESAPMHHTIKPDADNVFKAVADCLTQLNVWKDDCQVCEVTVNKRYSATNLAGVCIKISPLQFTLEPHVPAQPTPPNQTP